MINYEKNCKNKKSKTLEKTVENGKFRKKEKNVHGGDEAPFGAAAALTGVLAGELAATLGEPANAAAPLREHTLPTAAPVG